MNDLISRQAAIDALADYIHNVDKVYSTGKLSADDCKDAAWSVLGELPSAQHSDDLSFTHKPLDCISRQAAIDALDSFILDETTNLQGDSVREILESLPSAQPDPEKWNNHTVACLLAELFGDTCACNYNGIDEWLPEKCEVIDDCPNPVGVACWEQLLKHRAERRTDEDNNSI